MTLAVAEALSPNTPNQTKPIGADIDVYIYIYIYIFPVCVLGAFPESHPVLVIPVTLLNPFMP